MQGSADVGEVVLVMLPTDATEGVALGGLGDEDVLFFLLHFGDLGEMVLIVGIQILLYLDEVVSENKGGGEVMSVEIEDGGGLAEDGGIFAF